MFPCCICLVRICYSTLSFSCFHIEAASPYDIVMINKTMTMFKVMNIQYGINMHMSLLTMKY